MQVEGSFIYIFYRGTNLLGLWLTALLLMCLGTCWLASFPSLSDLWGVSSYTWHQHNCVYNLMRRPSGPVAHLARSPARARISALLASRNRPTCQGRERREVMAER